MDESREIRTMRLMAWERAKGELYSMINTYWNNKNFDQMKSEIIKFVDKVEDEGWQE